mmetsp:Transcript_11144/g.35391  ORF Transcript_11144/g.35391 Transcript_11144/m.35391 type:complete len:227 (+) Transcript_11144:1642-2322(+)
MQQYPLDMPDTELLDNVGWDHMCERRAPDDRPQLRSQAPNAELLGVEIIPENGTSNQHAGRARGLEEAGVRAFKVVCKVVSPFCLLLRGDCELAPHPAFESADEGAVGRRALRASPAAPRRVTRQLRCVCLGRHCAAPRARKHGGLDDEPPSLIRGGQGLKLHINGNLGHAQGFRRLGRRRYPQAEGCGSLREKYRVVGWGGEHMPANNNHFGGVHRAVEHLLVDA